MKKFVVLLAVALMAAPVLAVVTVGGSVDGKAITISYDKAEGEALRGVALIVEIENGKLASLADLAPMNTEFNAFIDYYVENDIVEPLPGVGAHPLCNPDAAGVADLTTMGQKFGICMGYLDQDGDETLGEAAPGLNKELVTFTVTCLDTADAIVKVSLDDLRGGIVGDNITVSVPDMTEVGTIVCGNLEPECWGYACFAKGDVNGDGQLTYNGDVQALINAWNSGTYDPCVDFNKDGVITYTGDVQVLINNWTIGCN
jgi:hypothetical protein